MKIGVTTHGDLRKAMAAEYLAGERAVTGSMRRAQKDLVAAWRGQVVQAGLGRRLANSIRGATYPKGTDSMNAAALVYTKAPKIIGAFEAGPVIRSQSGLWLAIPLPAAGHGRYGRKMTPATWERRHGIPLRFVYRRGKNPLLVAEDARLSTGKRRAGEARRKRGRRRKDGILTGATTVPVFVLVRQAKLRKRLDLGRDIDAVAARITVDIVRAWDTD